MIGDEITGGIGGVPEVTAVFFHTGLHSGSTRFVEAVIIVGTGNSAVEVALSLFGRVIPASADTVALEEDALHRVGARLMRIAEEVTAVGLVHAVVERAVRIVAVRAVVVDAAIVVVTLLLGLFGTGVPAIGDALPVGFCP